jgi:tetratricopeptide (TPR) repeat protein
MNKLLLGLSAVFVTIFWACADDTAQQKMIEGLEQRLAAQFTNERSDSLVNLYRDLVKAHPDDHANNLHYLTRAAEIQFVKRKDGAPATRWLDDAMAHHSEGQDLTEIISLYARIYNGVQYHTESTYSIDSKDMSRMQTYLLRNNAWLDSALVRTDRKMTVNGMVTDKDLANKYIEISEGYAAITTSNDKYAELLSMAGGLAKTIESFNKAIVLYHRLSERLPEHPKARTALFMQGFIYENDLGDIAKAKAIYEEFLQKYSDDADYADDVKMALLTLGKSAEEIVKGFQKQ